MFYHFTGNSLTWLYRRRFADFPFNDEWNLFFKKAVTYDTEKYTSIIEVKEYILAEINESKNICSSKNDTAKATVYQTPYILSSDTAFISEDKS